MNAMQRILAGTSSLFLVFAVAFFSACSGSEDDWMGDGSLAVDTSAARFYLVVSTPGGGQESSHSAHRATGKAGIKAVPNNPTGGEDGDGREPGKWREDNISDLTAFFFEDEGGKGVNVDGNTKVATMVHFNSSQFVMSADNTVRTTPVKVSGIELDKKYGIVVIANAGDRLSSFYPGPNLLSLSDLLNYKVPVQTWDVEGTSVDRYCHFMMSSARGDEYLKVTLAAPDGSNTFGEVVEDGYVFTTNKSVALERLAARVDFRTVKESFDLIEDGVTRGTLKIDGATLVNVPNLTSSLTTQYSYLVKRVVKNAGDAPVYCADEEAGDGGATNYVIEPKTYIKKDSVVGGNLNVTADEEADFLKRLYGGRAFRYFGARNTGTTAEWDEAMTMGDAFVNNESGTTVSWNRLGYIPENTVADPALQDSRLVTGIVFRALFDPEDGLVKGNYDKDRTRTFFAWDKKLYATLTDMMKDMDGEESKWRKTDVEMEAMTWGQVRDFASSLNVTDPTGYRNYLLEKAADKAEEVDHKAQGVKGWNTYMRENLGYSEAKIGADYFLPLINQNGKITREELARGGVRVFENGHCYYTHWIKHANDGDETQKGIMEYGIVRNNLYRITINGMKALGSDLPTDMDDLLTLIVAVKDWVHLDNEILDLQ